MLIEVTLRVDDRASELVDALLEFGALSVTIEDAHVDSGDEQAVFGEPGGEPEPAWTKSRLRVLAPLGDADQVIAAACEATSIDTVIEASRAVEDVDWVRETQAQFPPTQISERLWIVPTWHKPPDNSAINIRLDPGSAFGTGTHATTRLCLAWLDAHLRSGASVLDYGCGSGILAIAACKLGAANVIGVDIDRQAIDTARTNARANGVSARYTDPDELSRAHLTFDVVLANILSSPLKVLAPALLARVAPSGSLVLSGILERQADDVIQTYSEADAAVRMSIWRSEEGWVCLVGTRPAT